MKSSYMVLAAAFAASIVAGCTTTVQIQAAKPYEGRYSDSESLVNAAKCVEFGNGEQVWLISAPTLKRLLKSTEK